MPDAAGQHHGVDDHGHRVHAGIGVRQVHLLGPVSAADQVLDRRAHRGAGGHHIAARGVRDGHDREVVGGRVAVTQDGDERSRARRLRRVRRVVAGDRSFCHCVPGSQFSDWYRATFSGRVRRAVLMLDEQVRILRQERVRRVGHALVVGVDMHSAGRGRALDERGRGGAGADPAGHSLASGRSSRPGRWHLELAAGRPGLHPRVEALEFGSSYKVSGCCSRPCRSPVPGRSSAWGYSHPRRSCTTW